MDPVILLKQNPAFTFNYFFEDASIFTTSLVSLPGHVKYILLYMMLSVWCVGLTSTQTNWKLEI